ncbi:MAG: electron transport complex subunit RsxG [Rhodocyclaceae bacterium]|nr:electron transport complex subunit RsxG [Rhodocyclaceae bacterium]
MSDLEQKPGTIEPANPDTGAPVIAPPQEESVVRVSARTATILLVFTMAFTALMAGTYNATKPMLDASALAEKLRAIDEVLPRSAYDNDLLADFVELPPTRALGSDDTTRLYRARKDGKPVAYVLEAAAPDGYAGRIGLILAIAADGRLLAQRVTTHKETPGLGDYIDPKKDKNKARPWITQFNDKLLADVTPAKWRVKKDGGIFDQMSGATISARAVTNASGRAMAWATERGDKLFAIPSGGKLDN